MGSIIDRALDIINDHLKDQTSSFPDPISIKPMKRGGTVMQDEHPTHYMPEVGRQVMAGGGMPDPVSGALQTARGITEEPHVIPPTNPAALTGRGFEGRVNSPKLAKTFAKENVPGVIVSPRPGKGSGPRVLPERGVPYEQPEYEGYGAHGETPTSDIEFSPSTPDLAGTALPPPVQHPLQNEPRLQKVTENTQRIIKTPGFRKLVEDHVGLKGPLQVTPTHGTWHGEAEPSFILSHPDMQQEHAERLAHLLGFGFQQDAVVRSDHNPNMADGTLAALIGHGKKLTAKDIDGLTDAAKKEGLDYTITKDGKAAKFLHFGSDEEYPEFLDKVGRIADLNRFKERYNARTQGSLINAQDYLSGIFGKDSGGEGVQDGTTRSPDLFGRIVDHVLAPYAKAVAGEGYRLSPERLAETFGLTQDEQDKVRSSLYPNTKGDRTTVPLMTGEETLDVRPTGARGNDTVNDVLYALQNRAAEKGQNDPGDFSDRAKKSIASDIAHEVKYHVDNSEKSAVGWYDDALKKAKDIYHQVFPELKTDKDKEMLFDAILGITSQGNDVHSNSVFAARVYDKLRNEKKSIPEAVKDLSGGFGAQTKAIEGNLMKLHHLLDQNGFDRMRDLFNQKKSVSEWNKILRTDPSLKVPGQEQLKMQGAADQKVTGWMVFGPKIGSFINNLHGDYSTLTADLWFSRTWNRLLGHNFIHSPLAEQKQYQDFKDAIKAEFLHHNGLPHEQYAGKTNEGQYVKDASGNVKPWTFGNDMKDMSHDDFNNLVNDPEKMQELANNLYEQYKGGGFKDKSDARRRAKNWMENRDLPVAAPRGDKERDFQQRTVEDAQKLLKRKYGLDISIADIQAALWFHEKELFSKLGVAPERAQPADYADAAKNAMDLINKGELYHVKSKAAPESWYWSKYLKEKAPKAFGGGITPVELSNNNFDDEARRLILWSYATAPLFGRKEGGRVKFPVAMTKEAKDVHKKKHAKLKQMKPQEFLNETDPLHIGKGDRQIIDTFKHNIKTGHHLGPLKIYNNGGQDGRHRANAAKELGIKTVPVIDYRKAAGGPVDDAQNAVDIARNLTPMGFYSAAAEAASKIPQRAPIDQIINKITGQPNVKKEELANANLKDAFAGQRSVDPKEVARHLQASVPQIKERVYGGKPAIEYKPEVMLYHPKEFENADEVHRIGPEGKPPHYIVGNKRDRYSEFSPSNYAVYGPSGYHETYSTLADAVEHANNSISNIEQPLYKDYTVPGGENYREVVMALPPTKTFKDVHRVANYMGGEKKEFPTREEAEAFAATNPDYYHVSTSKEVETPKQYQSSHWQGIPNPLAHLRMSDRDNGKTLHVEELQSDWGQEGRRKGFGNQVTLSPLEEMEYFSLHGMSGSDRTEEQQNRLDELIKKMDASKAKPVPSAPYVTDTNQWVDLGLKRALMEAAKKGYDKIVFTPGQIQNDRYDLSQKLTAIHWSPDSNVLKAIDHDHNVAINQKVEKEKLPDFIGKDLADKLLSTKALPNVYRFEGDTAHSLIGGDLRIGGSGMKSFYDKLVPQRLNKLAAQYDPEAKVKMHSYPLSYQRGTGQQGDIDWEGRPVEEMETRTENGHELHITPKLRAAILKGLPAFEHGGSVLKRAFKVLSQYS